MSNIRVTYTGLIAFLVGIGSIITGTIFTLIVTRQLSVEEFGTWNLLGSIIGYTLLLESPIFFWITREVARGTPSAKTGIIISGMLSSVGMLIYVIIANVIGGQSNADVYMMIFAVILVPANFINHTLSGINAGWKPQVSSYGFIVTEISKIPMGIILIYFLDLGLLGLIITIMLSTCASIVVQLYYAKSKLKNKFEKKFVKKWIKLAWVASYRDMPGTLFVSDAIIFSTITGNVVGIAYMSAARAIGNLVNHSGKISTAIYPKMLSGGKQEHLQENFVRTLYFALPTIAFSVVFARAGLFTLNPEYEIIAPIVIFLSFRGLLSTINRIFRSSLQGIDKVDVSENSGFKDYIKSSLIVIPTARTIQYGSYIILLIIGLYVLIQNESSQLDLVNYWAIMSMCIEIPFLIYFSILIQRKFHLNLDFKVIFKYGICSFLSFGITHLLMEKYLVYHISVFDFIPNLMLYVIFGLACYFGITYLVDKKTRNLFNMIIKEIQNK